MKLALLSLGALLACAQLPAVAPSAVASTDCIVTDAGKGDSIAQIVLDCGGDVAQVVEILLASKPAMASETKAYGEAVRVKAAVQ